MLRSPLLSPAGRLRALAHPLTRRRRETGDESIGAYVQRRYGAEMLRVLGEPLLAGIHLADPWQPQPGGDLPGAARRAWQERPRRPEATGAGDCSTCTAVRSPALPAVWND